ncbi:hypothetical protein C5167_026658 [Papaver somniferum]|nr:hypothetical protein C5167_026658 [Papaver somniferum]
MSFPIDFPGTAYHKCLQGRRKAMEILKDMLQNRRAAPEESKGDFFDYVLEELKKQGSIVTEEIALDLIFLLLFASFETTTLAVTMSVKFLNEHPAVLKELTETQDEHEAIIRNRENMDLELTWKKYKSMTFTAQGADLGASKDFMAFGGGMRFCAGTDFAKVQMAVLRYSY